MLIFDRSVFLHLRFGFSYFLAPIFFFALSTIDKPVFWNALLTFIAFHFFIYPASNGYNSYFDKDEGSIALIKNPPPVNKSLYYYSLIFDLIGIVICFFVHPYLAIMAFIYGGISKIYSHPFIRLKKFPILSFLTVALFQGGFMFFAFVFGSDKNHELSYLSNQIMLGIIISTLLVGAGYPLTQIYQHQEDRKRGDKTMSLLLGIRGTFIFSALLFLSAGITMYYYYSLMGSKIAFTYFIIYMLPVFLFFFYWAFLAIKNSEQANFKNSMRMNFLSGTCMLFYFLGLCVIKFVF